MKKLSFALIMGILGVSFSYHHVAMTKADEKTKDNPQAGALSAKKVSTKMAEAWCEKLQECAPKSGMSEKECRKVLRKSFEDGFQKTATGQKIVVTEPILTQCVTSLHENDCNSLKSAKFLPGCEFISLLNRDK